MADDDKAIAPGKTAGDQDAADEPDDGLTADERAQFESMRAEEPPPTPADAGDATAAADGDAATADDAGKAAKAGDAATDGVDDDDDGADAAADKKPPRRVSWSRHKRTLEELQTLKGNEKKRDEERARLDERLRIINEALTPRQQAEQQQKEDDDPEPDPETDIFAHNAWLKRRGDRLEEAVVRMQQGTQAKETTETVERSYFNDVQQFQRIEPNFMAAYQHLMASRIGELALFYFDKDITEEGATLSQEELAQITKTIGDEERTLVQKAIKDGKSPAKRMFSLAKGRGFKAPAAAAADDAAAAAKPGGKAPGGLDAPASGKSKVAEEVARVREGSEASLSLSQGGGAPTLALTPEKLANMSQEEFNELMDTLSPAEQRRAMGA